MQTIRNHSIAALGAIVATFVTVSAAAPARAETATTTVSYQVLDLHSAKGMTSLRHRIEAAAARVCGFDVPPLSAEIQTCRRDAIARALASIPAPKTATLVAAR